MAISETARKNHDELFPGHVSTLAVTDPELTEIRQLRLRRGAPPLQPRHPHPAHGAARGAHRRPGAERIPGHARRRPHQRVTPAEVKEIVYQAVPYAGMGKVFDFLHATNDVLTGRGVQLPLGGQATTTPDTRVRTGRTVQEQIAGTERVKRMYSSAARDERPIQEFLSANCFGDHVARNEIAPASADGTAEA